MSVGNVCWRVLVGVHGVCLPVCALSHLSANVSSRPVVTNRYLFKFHGLRKTVTLS